MFITDFKIYSIGKKNFFLMEKKTSLTDDKVTKFYIDFPVSLLSTFASFSFLLRSIEMKFWVGTARRRFCHITVLNNKMYILPRRNALRECENFYRIQNTFWLQK